MYVPVDIPYIFRRDGKYCAVRMVDSHILNKFELILHRDVFTCAKSKCWRMHPWEVELFNEINYRHCDSQYGREPFTEKDMVIKLDDAFEFAKFLHFCVEKLEYNTKCKCGFFRIDDKVLIPYIHIKNETFLPIFYFDGDTKGLQPHTTKAVEWELAYLKFCFKAQGIPEYLYCMDYCEIVNFQVVKKYFPAKTIFEPCWPMTGSRLLIKNNIFIKQKV